MFRLVFKMYCSKLFIKFFSRYDPLPNHLEFLHPLKIVSNFYFIYKGTVPDPVFWGIFWCWDKNQFREQYTYIHAFHICGIFQKKNFKVLILIPRAQNMNTWKGFSFLFFFLTKSNTFSLVIQYVFEMC